MGNIFEIIDKSGRNIHLSNERWRHITTNHPAIANYLEDIQLCLINPIKITSHKKGDLRNYYLYLKHREYPEKFLKIIVKYLNGTGFILTAHFVRNLI